MWRRPIKQMLQMWTLATVLLPLNAVSGAAPGPEAQNRPVEPQPTHWSDALKDIPIGPFRLDVGGNIRFRFERSDDFNFQRYADTSRNALDHDGFLLQRSRLETNFRYDPNSRVYFEFQDARAYQSDFARDDLSLGPPYYNSFDMRQAYLEMRGLGGTALGIKVGRQRIFYGDNRIWGPGEWGNVGRYTWDAVKLINENELAETHFIFARRIIYDDQNFDNHDANLDALGVYSMIHKLPLSLDLFYVGKRTNPYIGSPPETIDLNTHTVGFYSEGRFLDAWDYGGTFAHIFGKRNHARVEAYGANAHIGYTFSLSWRPRLGLDYSFGSGDSKPDDGVYRTFDGIFGAVDKMYGRMNLFSWMNLHDYQVNLSCKPAKQFDISLAWHIFRLDEPGDAWYYCNGRPQRRDASGRSGSELGQEIDLIVNYKYDKHLNFQVGYAHFFPGHFVRRTGPSPDADWAFLQATYSF